MTRLGISITAALAAGAIAVYVLPAAWLAPVAEFVAVIGIILAVVVRVETKTVPPENHVAGVLLSIANLPEEPFAEVKESLALTAFLVSAAFLVALGIAVLVRANT